jgi:hypothetical protein
MQERIELRNAIFRAAADYHGAAAEYFRAVQRGLDLERPTQEFVGKALFYYLALSQLKDVDSTGFVERRMRTLRCCQATVQRKYRIYTKSARVQLVREDLEELWKATDMDQLVPPRGVVRPQQHSAREAWLLGKL